MHDGESGDGLLLAVAVGVNLLHEEVAGAGEGGAAVHRLEGLDVERGFVQTLASEVVV